MLVCPNCGVEINISEVGEVCTNCGIQVPLDMEMEEEEDSDVEDSPV
jgi:rRNA maturation endonuclease Nob1